MGMFDTIKMKIKCPYCGEEKMRDGQTKDTDCELHHWKVGDNTDCPDLAEVDLRVTCKSAQCGYDVEGTFIGGFITTREGRSFEIAAATPLGLITGKYRYLDLDNQLKDSDYTISK